MYFSSFLEIRQKSILGKFELDLYAKRKCRSSSSTFIWKKILYKIFPIRENVYKKALFKINFIVELHKKQLFLGLAYESRGIFFVILLLKENVLSYHFAWRTLRGFRNSIFGEFLNMMKNTLTFMMRNCILWTTKTPVTDAMKQFVSHLFN